MGLVRLDGYYAWRFSRIVNLDNYNIMPPMKELLNKTQYQALSTDKWITIHTNFYNR